MLYDPAGVGVTTGGGGVVAFELPPPQPGNRIIKPSSAISIGKRRRPGTASTIENSINPLNATQRPSRCNRGPCKAELVAAVVVTVIVEDEVVSAPEAFIEAGLNAQLAPAGSPEHARLIVPENPVE